MSLHESSNQSNGLQASVMAGGLASEIIANWPEDATFSAREAMTRFPEATLNKSVMIDLAYEEFHARRDAGEAIDPDDFVKDFPECQKSLMRLLSVERFMQGNSHLVNEREKIDWPEIGTTFLGFRLHEELGRGAFSRVFLASEIALGNRRVVVKVCRSGDREAYALGKLQHPNIVPVLSIQQDEERGLAAICMPFLTSATLYEVLDTVTKNETRPKRASEPAPICNSCSVGFDECASSR